MKKTVNEIRRAKALQKETATLARQLIKSHSTWDFLNNLFGVGWENNRENHVSLGYREFETLRTDLLVPCREKTFSIEPVATGSFLREGHENFAGNYQLISLRVYKTEGEYLLYVEEVFHTEYCVESHTERFWASHIKTKEALFKDELKYEKLQRELLELTKSRLIRLFV